MKTKIYSDPGSAARQLAYDLSQELFLAKKTGRNVLLLFSGGSALKILDDLDKNALGKFLTVGALDERYDPTNQNTNFNQITKTSFYWRAKKIGCCFIDTRVKKGQTQNQLARKFENELKMWKKLNKNGLILATLGMGEDGHIAGIMPFPESDERFKRIFCGKNWVAAYDAENKNPYRFRITTTITFLKLISKIFGFVCGSQKAETFKKIKEHRPISQLPAQLITQLKNISVYTDITL